MHNFARHYIAQQRITLPQSIVRRVALRCAALRLTANTVRNNTLTRVSISHSMALYKSELHYVRNLYDHSVLPYGACQYFEYGS